MTNTQSGPSTPQLHFPCAFLPSQPICPNSRCSQNPALFHASGPFQHDVFFTECFLLRPQLSNVFKSPLMSYLLYNSRVFLPTQKVSSLPSWCPEHPPHTSASTLTLTVDGSLLSETVGVGSKAGVFPTSWTPHGACPCCWCPTVRATILGWCV